MPGAIDSARRWVLPLCSAAALLLAAAAGEGAAREVGLALAALSGSLWLAALGAADRRSIVSSQLILAGALVVLVAGPGLLLVADPDLYAGGAPASLTPALALWAVGVHAIVAGALLAGALMREGGPRAAPAVAATAPRRRWIAAWALAGLSALAFLFAAGGPAEYLSNLDKTGGSTRGLTYLIWGLLVGKFASLALLASRWSQRRPPGWPAYAALVSSLVLVGLVGSRLLLVVALVQVLLLAFELLGPGRSFRVGAMISLALLPVVAIGLGELRRWQGTDRSVPFGTYLVDSGLPGLPRTYVNQYADGIRLAAIAREVVPDAAPYEYGEDLVRVVLQPLPRQIRPVLERSAPVEAVFSSGGGGNALPVPVVGYLQGGLVGLLLLPALLGAAVRFIDLRLSSSRRLHDRLALIGAATGAVIVFRGSLPQGMALAGIDVVGIYVAARLLLREETPAAADATTAT